MDGAVQAAEGAVDLVAVRPNFQTLSTCGTKHYQHMYIYIHVHKMQQYDYGVRKIISPEILDKLGNNFI